MFEYRRKPRGSLLTLQQGALGCTTLLLVCAASTLAEDGQQVLRSVPMLRLLLLLLLNLAAVHSWRTAMSTMSVIAEHKVLIVHCNPEQAPDMEDRAPCITQALMLGKSAVCGFVAGVAHAACSQCAQTRQCYA